MGLSDSTLNNCAFRWIQNAQLSGSSELTASQFDRVSPTRYSSHDRPDGVGFRNSNPSCLLYDAVQDGSISLSLSLSLSLCVCLGMRHVRTECIKLAVRDCDRIRPLSMYALLKSILSL